MTSGICQFSSVGLNLLINLVLSCPQGYFSIGFMSRCRPWLTCRDLSDIQVGRLIGSGAVKAVFVARWRDMNMAHNELINDDDMPMIFCMEFKSFSSCRSLIEWRV